MEGACLCKRIIKWSCSCSQGLAALLIGSLALFTLLCARDTGPCGCHTSDSGLGSAPKRSWEETGEAGRKERSGCLFLLLPP